VPAVSDANDPLTFRAFAYPAYASARGPISFCTLARWMLSSTVNSSFGFGQLAYYGTSPPEQR
jgi:hypothetical protein